MNIDSSFSGVVPQLRVCWSAIHMANDTWPHPSYTAGGFVANRLYPAGTFVGHQGNHRANAHAGSYESAITHLHDAIRNCDTGGLLDPTPYMGYRLNYYSSPLPPWFTFTSRFASAASWVRRHPDGHFVQVPGRPEIYYVHEGRRLHVRVPDILTNHAYGGGWRDIIAISDAELASYPIGDDIFVGPRLLTAPGSPRVWYIFNDRLKRELASPQVLNGLGLPWNIETVSQYDIDRYLTDPVAPALFAPMPEGTLVKSSDPNSPTVYLISNGRRRPIASEAVFRDLGYTFQRVRLLTPAMLINIPIGPTIDQASIQ